MAHRVFQDSSGRLWEAWAVKPSRIERRSDVPGPPPAVERRQRTEPRMKVAAQWRNGWLAFQNAAEKRRLAPYPQEWAKASDATLEQLCDSAFVVGSPRRLLE